MTENKFEQSHIPEDAILIGVHIKGTDKTDYLNSLSELSFLAETAGVNVTDTILVTREAISTTFVLGSGKVEEILSIVERNKINLLIFDMQFTPLQERNLRKFFKIKVLDRVELILDIFAKRAKSFEAKIQIELAQLKYLLPRLTRMWEHLSRQIGGVGVRGPGETQIEIDRRRIRERIHKCNEKLKEIRKNRKLQRKNRNKKEFPQFALVGYTNAGKSSLLNLFTDSDVFVENQLFCTLDSVSRKLEIETGQTVILTDTVGFIRKLPHFLVESFKATLEEVIEADCLLHIIDGSDPEIWTKVKTIEKVIHEELKVPEKDTIIVVNKIDKMSENEIEELRLKLPEAIFMSAKTSDNSKRLIEAIADFIQKRYRTLTFMIPMDKLQYKQHLYTDSTIHSEEYTEKGLLVSAKVNEKTYGILKDFEIKS